MGASTIHLVPSRPDQASPPRGRPMTAPASAQTAPASCLFDGCLLVLLDVRGDGATLHAAGYTAGGEHRPLPAVAPPTGRGRGGAAWARQPMAEFPAASLKRVAPPASNGARAGAPMPHCRNPIDTGLVLG